MGSDTPSRGLGKVVQIDEEQIKSHLGEMVRESVEDTLSSLLLAEADQLCKARRFFAERPRWGEPLPPTRPKSQNEALQRRMESRVTLKDIVA